MGQDCPEARGSRKEQATGPQHEGSDASSPVLHHPPVSPTEHNKSSSVSQHSLPSQTSGCLYKIPIFSPLNIILSQNYQQQIKTETFCPGYSARSSQHLCNPLLQLPI